MLLPELWHRISSAAVYSKMVLVAKCFKVSNAKALSIVYVTWH